MAKIKRRSAAKRLEIVEYADAHGVTKAVERFNVYDNQVYQWRKIRDKLAKFAAQEAKQEPDRVYVDKKPVSTVRPSQTPAEPSTPRQAITGLGPLIADVRAAVIEELCEKLGGVISGMVDDRMPDIVARELRKLLNEGKEEKKEPAPLRAVKSA